MISGFQGVGSPLENDVDLANLVTPDPSKAVSFGNNNVSEFDPSAKLYSPTQPSFYPSVYPFPYQQFQFPDPDTLTPAPMPNLNPGPQLPRKSILKRKRGSAAAKSIVSRSTSSGSCKENSQGSIKIESDDDEPSQISTSKKSKSDSVSVNVLMDLIKSLNSLNQANNGQSSHSEATISSVVNQAAVKCTGPVRDLRGAMDLTRNDKTTSKKLVTLLAFA